MSTDELRICARRVLIAWDGTVLPKSRDPLMQERMGDLRSSLEAQPQPEPATDLAHELWAMAQSPGPISEVCALMAKRLAQPQPEAQPVAPLTEAARDVVNYSDFLHDGMQGAGAMLEGAIDRLRGVLAAQAGKVR